MIKKQIENYSFNVTEAASDKVLAIDIEMIRPNPYQPRREIAEEKIVELAQSIRTNGLIQPVVVRRVANGYQLAVGERRLLACRRLGWKKISAAVKILSDDAMATIALVENLQREDLNYIEEALGYISLMNNFNLTQESLARRLGRSQSTIANKIRLLKLSEPVRSQLLDKGLSERHARALLRLCSDDDQIKAIHEIVAQGLTVKQAEKRIEKLAEIESSRKKTSRSKPIIRDMRIVLNTIREAVGIIRNSGLYPEVIETVEPDYIEVRIRLTREMLKSDPRQNKT